MSRTYEDLSHLWQLTDSYPLDPKVFRELTGPCSVPLGSDPNAPEPEPFFVTVLPSLNLSSTNPDFRLLVRPRVWVKTHVPLSDGFPGETESLQ